LSAGELELTNMKIQLDMASARTKQLEAELARWAGAADRLRAAEKQVAEGKAINAKLAATTQELLASAAAANEEKDNVVKLNAELEAKVGEVVGEKEFVNKELERLRKKYEEAKRAVKFYMEKYNSCKENHTAAR
jgi:chromosome segregation ATPase